MSENYSPPTYADILEAVKTELTDIYGVTDFSSNTVQGQIANLLAKTKYDASLLYSYLWNSLSLDAEGTALDRLGRLLASVTRRGATFTTTNITITANRTVALPNTFTVGDLNGNRFVLENATTINAGSTSLLFKSQVSGVVNPSINTLTQIITPVVGVISANNPAPPLLIGNIVETDALFRERIKISRAINSSGGEDSLYAGLINLENVSDVRVYSHRMPEATAFVPEFNIWCIVEGGDNTAIANVIANKNSFASMIGNVIINYTTAQGSTVPIRFDRPSLVEIYVRGTIQLNSTLGDLTPLYNYIVNNITYKIGESTESSLFIATVKAYLQENNVIGTPYDFEVSRDNINWFNVLAVDDLKEKYVVVANQIDITEDL